MKTIEQLFIEYIISKGHEPIDLKDTFVSLCRFMDEKFDYMSSRIEELERVVNGE